MDKHLHLKPDAVKPYQELIRAVNKEPWIPCRQDPDAWDNYDKDGVPIPTEAEAQEMCAGCPVAELCGTFATIEKPAIGIYAGHVHGRAMIAAERSGFFS